MVLSIAIPSYNSQDYLDKAVRSVLEAGLSNVEVLIVDDGSKDRTADMADEYEKQYPGLVKALHKENGGHGDAVMCGLAHASGTYFKVLDSDDWLDLDALKEVVHFLEAHAKPEDQLDMVISDYVYEKVGEKPKRIGYENALPVRSCFSWKETEHFHLSQYILMHSVIYRTELLRICGLQLPKHTFYVDNLYVYYPLPKVENMYYLNVDLYHYFIGRDDQSVSEANMIKRIDQQLLVTRLMVASYDLETLENKNVSRYMSRYLAMMMSICTVFLIKNPTAENEIKKKEIWDYLKSYPGNYRRVRRSLLGRMVHARTKLHERVILVVYDIARKRYHFN